MPRFGVIGKLSSGRHVVDVILSKLGLGRHQRALGEVFDGNVPAARTLCFGPDSRALLFATDARELAYAAAAARELSLTDLEPGRELSFSASTRTLTLDPGEPTDGC